MWANGKPPEMVSGNAGSTPAITIGVSLIMTNQNDKAPIAVVLCIASALTLFYGVALIREHQNALRLTKAGK